MSKHLERLTATNQRRKPTESQPLEAVKATAREGLGTKSAWSLTKIKASSGESLK